MKTKVISFGTVTVYRSVCKCCGSVLEYDASNGSYMYNDGDVYYALPCPACSSYNEFYAKDRVAYSTRKLATILPHYA